LSFYLSAFWCLVRIGRTGTIIVAKTDPPLMGVIALLAAKLRRATLVNWFQDVFPEIAEVGGIGGAKGRFVFYVLKALRNWSVRKAALNVVLGERMAKALSAHRTGAKFEIITNSADGTLIWPVPRLENGFRRLWGL